jgi:hypothetical protein
MNKYLLLYPFVFALIFVYLFQGQQAGLNVLLFNLLLIGGVFWSGRLLKNNRLHILLSSGALISAVMVVFYGSTMSMAANIISLILLLGLVAANDIQLLINSFTASVFASCIGTLSLFR